MSAENNTPLKPQKDNISLLKNNTDFTNTNLDPTVRIRDINEYHIQLEKINNEHRIAEQTLINDSEVKQRAFLNASKAVKGAFSLLAGTILMEYSYMLYRDKPFLGSNFILALAVILATALVIFHFGMCRDVFRLKQTPRSREIQVGNGKPRNKNHD